LNGGWWGRRGRRHHGGRRGRRVRLAGSIEVAPPTVVSDAWRGHRNVRIGRSDWGRARARAGTCVPVHFLFRVAAYHDAGVCAWQGPSKWHRQQLLAMFGGAIETSDSDSDSDELVSVTRMGLASVLPSISSSLS